MLRTDLAYFAETMLDMEIVDHHKAWSRLVAKFPKLCINAPRDHGKSFMFSFAYTIWRLYYNWLPPLPAESMKSIPRVSIGYIFSGTQDQSIKLLDLVKMEIQNNSKLRWLEPTDADSAWAKQEIKCSNGAIARARGYGVGVRGAHPVWILCDDVLTDETIYSELVRRKQIDYFFSAITPMLVPGGQLIVIGCVSPETYVITPRGPQKIGSLVSGDLSQQKMVNYNKPIYGENGFKEATHYWFNGKCKTKKITTTYGLEIQGSHRHPLRVQSGKGTSLRGKLKWERMDNLKLKDMVYLEIGQNVYGNEFDDVELAYFMGLYTSEGSSETCGRITICSKDKTILEYLDSKPMGYDFSRNKQGDKSRVQSVRLYRQMESLGVKFKRAEGKEVPSCIFSASKRAQAAFLRGFADGDGCSYIGLRLQQINLSSASCELILGIRALLLNMGILPSYLIKPPGVSKLVKGKFNSHQLVMSAGYAYKWMTDIGFTVDHKKKTFKPCLAKQKLLVGIKKIEDGECETVDFVVPDGHSFCSNGFISHNTPFHQQDLYIELKENSEYYFCRFPALDEATETKPLWPSRYNLTSLEQKKREVGSTRFAREYMCLDEDTPIKTIDGFKKIKDVVVGDRVLSHDGEFHLVEDTYKNELDDRKVFRVKTSNGIGHVLTGGHELYVATTNYRRDVATAKTEWIKVEDIKCRPSERIYLKTPVEKFAQRYSTDIETAYLAGWYLAEGHCGGSQQVVLSLNKKDPIDKIQAASLSLFGKEFKNYQSSSGCDQWALNSKEAKFVFGLLGKGSNNKRIPDLFKYVSDESKITLLKAYFQGDGHFDGMTLECQSVSFQLICDVSDLLLSLGIACQIQTCAKAGASVIMGRDVMVKDSWRLKIGGSNLDKFFDLRSRRNSGSFVEDGFLYSRIKNIREIDYKKTYVYDLRIKDSHSYVGLHGTFHNCTPISDDSSLFPDRILKECYDNTYEMPTHLTNEDRQHLQVFTGVDLAMSSTVGADFTVITTIGIDSHKNRWILDIRRKKGLSMSEQLREIQDTASVYRPLKILIEDNAFQRVFADELIKNTDLPVEGFTTTARSKNNGEDGLPALQILFENKKFIIPRKTERDRRITDILVNELRNFTFVDGKLQGLGAHDDCVMSLFLANMACQQYQFGFSFVGE
jgi:intein/homing endonuclease